MPVKTIISPLKTKHSNQLIKPLHTAPSVHHLRDAQCRVRASNVFISNHLVAKLPNVCACLLQKKTTFLKPVLM